MSIARAILVVFYYLLLFFLYVFINEFVFPKSRNIVWQNFQVVTGTVTTTNRKIISKFLYDNA